MAKKGGPQPGSGRPKASHTLQAELMRQFIIEECYKHRDTIISALIKKAESGRIEAIKEVLDRVLGRPMTVELPAGGTGSLTVKWQDSPTPSSPVK